MMDRMINKTEAIELFEKNAVLLWSEDGVLLYKAVELFGEEILSMFDNRTLEAGVDWNCSDSCYKSLHIYERGFLKLVKYHNYLCSIRAYDESEAKCILDEYWKNREKKAKDGRTNKL